MVCSVECVLLCDFYKEIAVCEEADVAPFSLLSHHLSEGLKKITKESYLTKFKYGVSRIRST
jgi:hypothetical protein